MTRSFKLFKMAKTKKKEKPKKEKGSTKDSIAKYIFLQGETPKKAVKKAKKLQT
jgi:hypothetical protein